MAPIYILPYFQQGIEDFTWEDILSVIHKHQLLYTLIGKEVNGVMPPNYLLKKISHEAVHTAPYNYYLPSGLKEHISNIEVMDLYKDVAQWLIKTEESQKADRPSLKDIFGMIKQKMDQVESMDSIIQKLQYVQGEKGEIPVIELADPDIRSYEEVLEQLVKSDVWLFQLIQWMAQLTRYGVVFKPEFYQGMDALAYFTFSEVGTIKYFIGFHTVDILEGWQRPHGLEFIEKNNLQVLKHLITQLYTQLLMGSEDTIYPDTSELPSSHRTIRQVYEQLEHIYTFSDLTNRYYVRREGMEIKEEPSKKIGIFVDSMTMYTPLKIRTINLDHLLICLYGIRGMRGIACKYSVLFNANKHNPLRKYKRQQIMAWQTHLAKTQGFHLLEMNTRVSGGLDDRSEIGSGVERAIEAKAELGVERAIETTVESVIEPQEELEVRSLVETKMELEAERAVETKVGSKLETEMTRQILQRQVAALDEIVLLTEDGEFVDTIRRLAPPKTTVRIIVTDVVKATPKIIEIAGTELLDLGDFWEASI